MMVYICYACCISYVHLNELCTSQFSVCYELWEKRIGLEIIISIGIYLAKIHVLNLV